MRKSDVAKLKPGPKIDQGFDWHEKIFSWKSPADLTGLNGAVKTFILMSYEHRI
ncbi:MAG TPA: hypothetical protein VGD61_01910 [Pyrinomonadaceae bacterium]